jgi:hypothetical protein
MNPNYSIVHDIAQIDSNNEEAYLNYCRGIGLPKYSSFLLANFAHKLHQTLPDN